MTKKKRELILGLAFTMIVTLATLVVGEIALRVITSRHLIYNIEMVKYARELKMRDPRGIVSHVHRPLARAQLMGAEIALNSLGNRGPELIDPKPPGTRRVLVLGSSITMGWGVPFDAVFTTVAARQLQERQPFGPAARLEIVNAGIGNYNTVFQHQLFLDQYPRVRPDLVVLHYFISDAQPRTMGRDSAILKHSLLAAFCFDRLGQIRFRGEKKDLFTFYSELHGDASPAWQSTREHIAQMRDRCRQDGVPFAIMILPDIHDLSPGTAYGALYGKMEAAFRSMDVPVLNTFDAFQQRFGGDVSQVWIQSDDPHPNVAGHGLMADEFYQFLVRENPLRLPVAPRP